VSNASAAFCSFVSHHLVHGRFHETSADLFSISVAIAIGWDEPAIATDVGTDRFDRFEQLVACLVLALEGYGLQVHLDKIQVVESLEDIPVPEILLML
jgi:hypothetical protein